jgi:transposase-like protein
MPMQSAVKIEKMVCPTCGRRLFDKEAGAMGFTREKCRVCKSIWRVDLAHKKFTLIAGKARQRR